LAALDVAWAAAVPVAVVEPPVVAVPVAVPAAEEELSWAQMPWLTVTAVAASAVEQAFTRQGPTEAVIAAKPVVHWQWVSLIPQLVVAIAVVKQETEHDGRSAIVYVAVLKAARERTAEAIVNFMVKVVAGICSSGRV